MLQKSLPVGLRLEKFSGENCGQAGMGNNGKEKHGASENSNYQQDSLFY